MFLLTNTSFRCETFRTEVISCQKSLLNQTEVDRFEMFQDMFTSLCISLSSADPQNKGKLFNVTFAGGQRLYVTVMYREIFYTTMVFIVICLFYDMDFVLSISQ